MARPLKDSLRELNNKKETLQCHTSLSEKKTELTPTSTIKTGAAHSQSCSATAGLSQRTIGIRRCFFFLGKGFRVIAHDRRGHGRSTQTDGGHDMDHYADDLAALTAHLDLKNAVHVGHSTGGGEVVHYIARHGESRVAKAAIISAVPPLMVKTEKNPGGLPKKVFDDLQAQLAASRTKFYYDLASGPFYGFNRPGAKKSDAVIWNWWRQGMMGGAKAHYDGIVAFSQTDFTEDLKKITVSVLVMHGDDDQIVPYADSAPLSAKLLKNSTLKTYKGFPHGMPTTQADTINADLLAFIKS